MVKCKALVTRVSDGKARLVLEDILVVFEELPDHQVLVRTQSVAQNPTDVQCLDMNAFGEDAVLGCDFVGIVEKVGKNVTSVKVGDHISGLVWGGEIKGLGAFSEYTLADEKICFKVPDSISSADAATVPLAAATAWLALFSKTCLNIKRGQSNPNPVLVWGGSTSVGLYAIQLARIYSIPVVAICSPKHFDLCKNLGASHVFDYHDPTIILGIKSAVPNIEYVFDCIGNETSSTLASQTVWPEGGILCTVRPGKVFTENVENRVKVTDVLVWTAFLKDQSYKEFKWPASREDHGLSAELFAKVPGWLETGELKTNPAKVLPGGLGAVPEGFQMHRDGKISGFKIVYNL